MNQADAEPLFVFRAGVIFIERSADIALFYSFGDRILLQGPLIGPSFEDFCQLLRTPQKRSQLCQKLNLLLSPAAIEKLLTQLHAHYLLETIEEVSVYGALERNGTTPCPPLGTLNLISRLSNHHQSLQRAQSALAQAKLAIIDVGGCGHELQVAFEDSGFNSPRILKREELAAIGSYDLAILTATDADWPQLKALAKPLHQSQTRALLVLHDFFGGIVGPCFGMPDGACLECFALRRDSQLLHLDKQRAVDTYLSKHQESKLAHFQAFTKTVNQTAVTEALKILTELTYPRVYRGLYELDCLNHRTAFHDILPYPLCSTCNVENHAPPLALLDRA